MNKEIIYSPETIEKMKFWLYQSLIGTCFENDADDRESTIKKHGSDNWDEQTASQLIQRASDRNIQRK